MKDIYTEYQEHLARLIHMPGDTQRPTRLCSICLKPTDVDEYCECILPSGDRIPAPLCPVCVKLIHCDSVMGRDVMIGCPLCQKMTILRDCMLDVVYVCMEGEQEVLCCSECYYRTRSRTNRSQTRIACVRCSESVHYSQVRFLPGLSVHMRDLKLPVCPQCDLRSRQEWLNISKEEEE